MVLVGEARGKIAILVDDMADTCGTLDLASQRLKESGAERVLAIVTHGILSSPAIDRIQKSALEMLIVTNTLPQRENKRLRRSTLATCWPRRSVARTTVRVCRCFSRRYLMIRFSRTAVDSTRRRRVRRARQRARPLCSYPVMLRRRNARRRLRRTRTSTRRSLPARCATSR